MNFPLLRLISALFCFTVFARASDLTLTYDERDEMTATEPSGFEMSWFQYFVIGFLSPEALNILEKYEPRIVTITMSALDFNSRSVYFNIVNGLSIDYCDG